MALDRPTALWAIPVGDVGGVARHAVDVARTGIPGWRVRFLVPPGPVVDLLRGADAEVVVGDFGPAAGLARSVRTLCAASVGADLVHTHLSYADLAGALAKRAGAALVSTEHGVAGDDLVYHGSRARSRLRALAHHVRLRRVDALVAVSEATLRVAREKWQPGTGTRQVVVRNGVDAVAARAPEPGLHVLSLARLAPEKRLSELLAGFAVLAGRHPEARLTLAGTGPLATSLAREVAEHGLGDRVSLPGFVHPATAMAQAHVVAQLSVWENCSYSLLDAANHGLGVVASPVGGNPEILPAHCLVDPGDAGAVADLLADQGLDPTRRPELPADWPDVATMTKQVAEVYAEVAP